MDIVLPTWLGSFYGSAFSFEEYEYRTLQRISANSRSLEPLCIETRWFDYTRLHPLQATFYFAECYRRIYREYSVKQFGRDWNGLKENFFEGREAATVWAMRQYCDRCGYEYSWFIRAMLAFRLDKGEFKNHLPRPCHLLSSDPDELIALEMLWKMTLSGESIRVSTDPYFTVSSWVGSSRQIAHEELLIAQVSKKRVKHYALADLVYRRQVLRFEAVLRNFPNELHDVLKDAEKY